MPYLIDAALLHADSVWSLTPPRAAISYLIDTPPCFAVSSRLYSMLFPVNSIRSIAISTLVRSSPYLSVSSLISALHSSAVSCPCSSAHLHGFSPRYLSLPYHILSQRCGAWLCHIFSVQCESVSHSVAAVHCVAMPCRLLRAMLGYAMRGCAISIPRLSGLRQSVSVRVIGNRGVASPCRSCSLRYSAFHFHLTARPVRAIQFPSRSGHVFSSPLRFSVVLYFAFSLPLTPVLIVAFPLRFRALFRFASPFRFPSMLGFAIANELRAMRLRTNSTPLNTTPCFSLSVRSFAPPLAALP